MTRTAEPGPRGNERLTGSTAAVLLVLLAVEGLTVLSLRTFLSWHIFIGILLIPPSWSSGTWASSRRRTW